MLEASGQGTGNATPEARLKRRYYGTLSYQLQRRLPATRSNPWWQRTLNSRNKVPSPRGAPLGGWRN